MYYSITPHKTFIQKPYEEHTSELYKHMQSIDEREAFEVRHPLPYIDDQVWKGAILLKMNK